MFPTAVGFTTLSRLVRTSEEGRNPPLLHHMFPAPPRASPQAPRGPMTHVRAIACGQWTRQNRHLAVGAAAWNQSLGGDGMARIPAAGPLELLFKPTDPTAQTPPLGERQADLPWNLPWDQP